MPHTGNTKKKKSECVFHEDVLTRTNTSAGVHIKPGILPSGCAAALQVFNFCEWSKFVVCETDVSLLNKVFSSEMMIVKLEEEKTDKSNYEFQMGYFIINKQRKIKNPNERRNKSKHLNSEWRDDAELCQTSQSLS